MVFDGAKIDTVRGYMDICALKENHVHGLLGVKLEDAIGRGRGR